jgi:2-C-methyl-D-erythritol 2,4-cyclodiphosphate synthase
MSAATRVGIGFDAHRFSGARTLVLGGVEIQGVPGLQGYSDSDVLAHAVIDAVLGAAALGDIGRLYPDTDPMYENADSIELLRDAVARLGAAGWQVVNVDATVICERPRISEYAGEMAERLAAALGVAADRVSVKGSTSEGMGFTGREEGIATIAIAQVEGVDG